MDSKRLSLKLAAISAFLAAFAHLICIFIGAEAYRFMGAGERMAQMAEAGHWHPTIVTSIITVVLSGWGALALSGAGVIRKLPFLRTGLVLISVILIARGVGFVFIMPLFPDNSILFWLISSTLCLIMGLFFAFGTYRHWQFLSNKV